VSTRHDLSLEGLALGLQEPCFGRRDRLGNGLLHEFSQELSQEFVAFAHARGRPRQGKLPLCIGGPEFSQDTQGVAQQPLSVTFARKRSVGLKHGLAIGCRKAPAQDRFAQVDLRHTGEGAQAVGERRGKLALLDGALKTRLEALGKRIALADPRPLAPKQLGAGGKGVLVVLDYRRHDPGLVHGRDGPPGSIGSEQEGLGVRPLRIVDDDRELGETGVPRGAESFEAIDDLVGVGLCLASGDANGHGCKAVVLGGDVRA
jgi:hypothetical protein